MAIIDMCATVRLEFEIFCLITSKFCEISAKTIKLIEKLRMRDIMKLAFDTSAYVCCCIESERTTKTSKNVNEVSVFYASHLEYFVLLEIRRVKFIEKNAPILYSLF